VIVASGFPRNVFIGPTLPETELPQYVWIQTFDNGDFTVWIEDGEE
jgi:hypothetical protein